MSEPNVPPPEGSTRDALPTDGPAHTVLPRLPAEVETLALPSDGKLAAGWPNVPGFEILSVLGRGGMGVVYHARQIKLKRLVALKMILAGGHANDDDRRRFQAEAEAIARLRHPNIIQIYEIGEADGHAYFAMEYVEGGNLSRRKDWTPQAAARMVETLARAVHHAHLQKIVHRDLKPSNVLLTVDGEPKVTDFGLAKRLDASSGNTKTGAILGTPGFMAPEQALGRGKQVGPTADVWALGAILYKLLTGRPPFQEGTAFDTLMAVGNDEVVPPRRRNPGVPRELETVCLKCLEKQSICRFVTAEALADDLRRFQLGEPVLARPAGIARRCWRRSRRLMTKAIRRVTSWFRRHPRLAAEAGLLFVVALVGTVSLAGGEWRRWFSGDHAAPHAPRPRADGQPPIGGARQPGGGAPEASHPIQPVGRIAAVGALIRFVAEQRENPAAAAEIYATVVRPLLEDGGTALIGVNPDQELKWRVAQLAASTGSHIRRHPDAWERTVGQTAQPPELAVQLFDLGTRMDGRAEFIALRGLARAECPRPAIQEIDKDAAEAATADPTCRDAVTLAGVAAALRAEREPDAGGRSARLREADDWFRKSLALPRKAGDLESVLVLYRWAVRTAIGLGQTGPTDATARKAHLQRANEWAEQLPGLAAGRPECWDTVGMAREAAAVLLDPTKRVFEPTGYERVAQAFTYALDDGGGAAVRLHRGRCRFKWAAEKAARSSFRAASDLLGSARRDLQAASQEAPASVEAAEARYWLARADLLAARANPDRAAILAEGAINNLAAAAERARWYDATALLQIILRVWADAVYEDVVRRPVGPIRDAAVSQAGRLRAYSAPWHAYLRARLLLADNVGAGRPAEWEGVTAEGLSACRRLEDRSAECCLRLLRSEARTYSTAGADGMRAVEDARAAVNLVEKAVLPDDDCAAALGQFGVARAALLALSPGNSARSKARAEVEHDLRRALALTPDHDSAWRWKVALAAVLGDEEVRANVAEAGHLAEAYRLIREVEEARATRIAPASQISIWGQMLRTALETDASETIWAAIRTRPDDPDRRRWQLSLAEILAGDRSPSVRRQAGDLLADASGGMSTKDLAANDAQIQRIKKRLER
jgi:predicted Ser/Thr protein kinase